MKKPLIIALCVALVLAVTFVLLYPYLLHQVFTSRNGPRHIFHVSAPLAFLPESIAIENALAVLRLDRYEENAWHPASYASTVAPDGRPDIYLGRNGVNPNRGVLMFTNAQRVQCFVTIEMEGTNLICQRVYAK